MFFQFYTVISKFLLISQIIIKMPCTNIIIVQAFYIGKRQKPPLASIEAGF